MIFKIFKKRKIRDEKLQANIKQQEIKDQVAVLYRFFLEVPSKHEIQCKKGVYFPFEFGCYSYSIHLDIVR